MTSTRNLCLFLLALISSIVSANPPASFSFDQHAKKPALPQIITPPPDIQAKAYLLIDIDSDKIIAEKDGDKRIEPASMTKILTMYIVSSAIKSGQITLDSLVPISEKAWRTGGSRMFVKVGSKVPVRELIQGIIVASGNDACLALAEYLSGTEEAFAQVMNQTAASLGMTHSHFVSSTGMPSTDHYTTPHDLAILAKALIKDYPEYYKWYKQKWFNYNNIKQPNRNRLLWRDDAIDGIKTGHTNSAGYCLIASAKKENTRLISVIAGAANDNARINGSHALLTYGFRFYRTHRVFSAHTPLTEPRVWSAQNKTTPFGIMEDFSVTIPVGQYENMKAKLNFDQELKSPIIKGQAYGNITVTLNDKVIATKPLVALSDNPTGSVWVRFRDHVSHFINSWSTS